MIQHFHFQPKIGRATSVPNSSNTDNKMRIFIPVYADVNSCNIEVNYRVTSYGLLILQFSVRRNKDFNKESIQFCCIEIENVYRRQSKPLEMIVTKTKIIHDPNITNGSPGKFKLFDMPKWPNQYPNQAIKFSLNDNCIPIPGTGNLNENDIIEGINNSLSKEDSCTIPPKP